MSIKSVRNTASTSNFNCINWALDARRHRTVYFRGYFNFDTNPGATRPFITVWAAGGPIASFRLNTSFEVQSHDRLGSLVATSNAMSLDTWYRIEFKLTIGASSPVNSLEVEIWNEAGTVLETSQQIANVDYGTGYLEDLFVGAGPDGSPATAWTIYFDDIGYDWYDWLGNTVVPLTNSSEGGSVGTTVTSVNSGGSSGDAFNTTNTGSPDASPAGTLTYESSPTMHGNRSVRSTKTSTVGYNNAAWNSVSMDSGNELYFRGYFVFHSKPSVSTYLINLYNGGTFTGGLAMSSSTGAVWILDKNITALHPASAHDYSDGQVYRMEFWVRANGMWEFRTYIGDSTSPLQSWSGVGAIFEPEFSSVRVGASHLGASAHTFDLSWDDLAVHEVGWWGPSEVAVTGEQFILVAAGM
jgi:hypothetical protein